MAITKTGSGLVNYLKSLTNKSNSSTPLSVSEYADTKNSALRTALNSSSNDTSSISLPTTNTVAQSLRAASAPTSPLSTASTSTSGTTGTSSITLPSATTVSEQLREASEPTLTSPISSGTTGTTTTTTTTSSPYADYLLQQYQNSLNNASDNYNTQVNALQAQADKAKQEAYLSYMQSKKDLDQRLAAGGLTGGASESALAGLSNAYMSSRNNIDDSLASNLASLGQNYSDAKTDLYNNYLSSLASNSGTTTTSTTGSNLTSGVSDITADTSAIDNYGTSATADSTSATADSTSFGGTNSKLYKYIKGLVDSGLSDEEVATAAINNVSAVPYASAEKYMETIANAINTAKAVAKLTRVANGYTTAPRSYTNYANLANNLTNLLQ